MSNSYHVSIAFSQHLAGMPPKEKLKAITSLQEYFQAKSFINTGNGNIYHTISYAVEPFLNGRVDLQSHKRARVLNAELTSFECEEVQGLGFSTRCIAPQVFSHQARPEVYLS